MPLPQSKLARKFYRVAYQRLEESEVLYDSDYFIGTIYLAGYAFECILKSLILDSTPKKKQEATEAEFRSSRGHNFEWLRNRYLDTKSGGISAEISESLAFVSAWDTTLRYEPGSGEPEDARRFLKEVKAILAWADGRL